MTETLELPSFKGRPGWEFTDISGLDLDAYVRDGADVAPPVVPLFGLPEASRPLPDGVIVSSIEERGRAAPAS